MVDVTDQRRGPYEKGVARRKEILRTALRLYAQADATRPTLRAIADEVGLSESGVLHYFDSIEDMFVAVLEERDRAASARFDFADLDEALAYLASTTQEPGLTQLFVDVSANAATPGHPGARFMERHRERAAQIVRRFLGASADEAAVRVVLAAAEGLQLLWLTDRRTDVAGDLKALVEHLARQ